MATSSEEMHMGIKDWIASKVAGSRSYGNALGGPAMESASTLATAIFMSHGTHIGGEPTIFDTVSDMITAGFTPRFTATTETTEINRSLLTKNEYLLYENVQSAMLAYSYQVHMTAAHQYMKPTNASEFNKGLAPSLLQSVAQSGLFSTEDDAKNAVMAYLAFCESSNSNMVLNLEKPASSDLLEHLIVSAVKLCQAKSTYCFARTGQTGFDIVAVPLVNETLKSIYGATRQYNW
jgi:hypothetical protein